MVEPVMGIMEIKEILTMDSVDITGTTDDVFYKTKLYLEDSL